LFPGSSSTVFSVAAPSGACFFLGVFLLALLCPAVLGERAIIISISTSIDSRGGSYSYPDGKGRHDRSDTGKGAARIPTSSFFGRALPISVRFGDSNLVPLANILLREAQHTKHKISTAVFLGEIFVLVLAGWWSDRGRLELREELRSCL